MALALTGAAGFLAGVLLVAALGGAKAVTTTVTQRAAVGEARTVTGAGTVIIRTAVPDLVGQPLDVARQRLDRARFDVAVSGGGFFGVLDDGNWEVIGQEPAAGTFLEQGSTVHVAIQRR
jgi:beta-lactam-binding protein with PASTA domain